MEKLTEQQWLLIDRYEEARQALVDSSSERLSQAIIAVNTAAREMEAAGVTVAQHTEIVRGLRPRTVID